MAKFIALIATKRNLANGRGNNQQFKSVVGLVNDIFFGTTLAFRSIRMLEAKSVVNPPFFGGQWFKISFLAPQGISGGCNGFQLHPPVFCANGLTSVFLVSRIQRFSSGELDGRLGIKLIRR